MTTPTSTSTTEATIPTIGDVRAAVAVLGAFSQGIEPGCLQASAARSLVELFGEASKICSAVTTMLAGRVAQTQVWAQGGARSPAEWVSKATGAPLGQAIGILETAERLAALPATEAELRAGRLSPAQARAITDAAIVDPGAEVELLEAAARGSVRSLELQARARKAAADPVGTERRYRAAHERRDLTTWVDPEGSGRLAWRGTPDALAEINAALGPFVRTALDTARTEGRDERYGACAADALVLLARDRGRGADGSARSEPTDDGHEGERGRPARPNPRHLVRGRIDLLALARGTTEPGETCELEGGGPVPVSVMERILAEHPIVDLVLTRGRDITHVAHLGRSGDTFLKTAIEWRDPVCAIEGCTVATNLEIHHLEAVADGGATSLEQVLRLCGHHHDCITYRGYRLVGSHATGWHLEPPDPPSHPPPEGPGPPASPPGAHASTSDAPGTPASPDDPDEPTHDPP